jgi:hypothetical protein
MCERHRWREDTENENQEARLRTARGTTSARTLFLFHMNTSKTRTNNASLPRVIYIDHVNVHTPSGLKVGTQYSGPNTGLSFETNRVSLRPPLFPTSQEKEAWICQLSFVLERPLRTRWATSLLNI